VGTAPGDLYKCAPGGLDDWCYIFASRGNEEHWRRLVHAIGREDLLDDPRMADGPTRAANRAAVDAAITEWTSKRTKHVVMEIIAGAGVPCGAVLNTLELMHDPDLHARGMMQKIADRGPVRQVLGVIAQFEKSLVAKLKAARDRKKAATGKCGVGARTLRPDPRSWSMRGAVRGYLASSCASGRSRKPAMSSPPLSIVTGGNLEMQVAADEVIE
jgi:crotonobetainyl-CoA:carnitine CoA-transferase CaiB-like acyl-CoA transferase